MPVGFWSVVLSRYIDKVDSSRLLAAHEYTRCAGDWSSLPAVDDGGSSGDGLIRCFLISVSDWREQTTLPPLQTDSLVSALFI